MDRSKWAASPLVAGWDLLLLWRAAGAERRRAARNPVNIQPCRAVRVAGTQRTAIAAVIRDISTGGVLVRTEQELLPGQHLELTFGQPADAVTMQVRAEVRYARQIQEGLVEAWEAGCEFGDSPRIGREQLVGFILDQRRLPTA